MNRLIANTTHSGWLLHDAYWLGACIFVIHFFWLRPSFLKNKNIIFSLVVMTIFWPLTYIFSIFQIVRMRQLRP